MDEFLEKIAIAVNVRKDYFERLFALAKERVEQWYKQQKFIHAFKYMDNLIIGTVYKFTELEGELFPHYVLSKLGFSETNPIYVSNEKIDQDKSLLICDDVFEAFSDDVFVALGHDLLDFYSVADIDGVPTKMMGVEQLLELNKVWESPNQERPIREMIAILRSMDLKNKR